MDEKDFVDGLKKGQKVIKFIFDHSGFKEVGNAIMASHRRNIINTIAGDPKSWTFKFLNRATRGNWTRTLQEINRKSGLDI